MKGKSTRSVHPKKSDFIGDQAFADLKEAFEGAFAFERGKRRDLQVTRIRTLGKAKIVNNIDAPERIGTSAVEE